MKGHRLLKSGLEILLIALLLFGCSRSGELEKQEQPTATTIPIQPTEQISTPVDTSEGIDPFIKEMDLTYFSINDQDLKIDIVIPAKGDGPYPAIVFIFGGSWTVGGRKMFLKQSQWAAERGFVGVSIDHRLLIKMVDGKQLYPFPAQIHDSKCAIQWLRANAEKYKIDAERIGVVGFSSGGHLALLLALTDASDGLETDCGYSEYSSAVQAAVGLAPPIDLVELYKTSIKGALIKLTGGTPEEVPEEYKKASPIFYVDDDDPPILTIMGELDVDVPPIQGELLDSKMKEMESQHELIILEGKEHNYFGFGLLELYDFVFEFFEEYL